MFRSPKGDLFDCNLILWNGTKLLNKFENDTVRFFRKKSLIKMYPVYFHKYSRLEKSAL